MDPFNDSASTYEAFGQNEPFYAVMTHKHWKREHLDIEAFYQTGREQIAAELAELKDFGVQVGGGQAMDFGCGVGRLTYALADYFDEVVGVDVSSSMIEAAKENRQRDNCDFLVNKRPDLNDIEDSQFDFIYSDITIQHIPRPASENYLQEFVRLLKPGGLALFLVPNGPELRPGSLKDRFDRFYKERLRPLGKRLRGKYAVQVHYIAQCRVEQLIAQAGGELLRVQPRYDFRDRTIAYKPLFYLVKKSTAAQLEVA